MGKHLKKPKLGRALSEIRRVLIHMKFKFKQEIVSLFLLSNLKAIYL
jgi:hypothetical protein